MPSQSQSPDAETNGSINSQVFDEKTETSSCQQSTSKWQQFWHTLNWMPPWCRFDRDNPPVFSLWHNVLFGFAGAFTVANLYYNHPILNILARDFNVSYERVSQIPTLMQAGYATGLLLLCPLGDLLRRRQFVLTLVFFSASIWIGLCVTTSFEVFLGISFLTAVSTVTPQIMLPLVGDLAPPHRRAIALSIVVSGNLLGILLARILSGIVTEYTSWRNIYFLALGLQYLIFALLFLFMPDYPRTNTSVSYFAILRSLAPLIRKYPVLVQASLISFSTSACFTSFWTTLTFLLSGAPYHYSTLVIGLFALIGVAGLALGPLYANLFINAFVPNASVLIGLLIDLLGVCIGTYAGLHTVAGPIIQAAAIDAGMQITQIANRSAIYAVEPHGRNRVNTVFMLATFLGQLAGTAAGNRLYARGGWVASGSLSVGLLGFAVLVDVARGPYEEGWVGWRGGWTMRKRNRATSDGKTVEKSLGLARGQGALGGGDEQDAEKGAEAATAQQVGTEAGTVDNDERATHEAGPDEKEFRPQEEEDNGSRKGKKHVMSKLFLRSTLRADRE